MRITISVILIVCFFLSNAQRVKFDDPELSFSFKKPSSWVVFDNGYVIKVSPSVRDSATTYLTITYFSPPTPVGGYLDEDIPVPIPEASVATQFEDLPQSLETTKFFKSKAKWRTAINNSGLTLRFYDQLYLGQHWEIVSCAPQELGNEYESVFKKIVKSIRAKKKANG